MPLRTAHCDSSTGPGAALSARPRSAEVRAEEACAAEACALPLLSPSEQTPRQDPICITEHPHVQAWRTGAAVLSPSSPFWIQALCSTSPSGDRGSRTKPLTFLDTENPRSPFADKLVLSLYLGVTLKPALLFQYEALTLTSSLMSPCPSCRGLVAILLSCDCAQASGDTQQPVCCVTLKTRDTESLRSRTAAWSPADLHTARRTM